jgi:hypothetical protein
MATTSTIAVEHQNGKISQVYCHWDGYIENNGRILLDHYNSLSSAEELVSFGDISKLDQNCIPTGKHSFNEPEPGCTIYYGRDRGESDTEPRTFDNRAMFNMSKQVKEYDYLFADGSWLLVNRKTYKLVSELLSEKEVA